MGRIAVSVLFNFWDRIELFLMIYFVLLEYHGYFYLLLGVRAIKTV